MTRKKIILIVVGILLICFCSLTLAAGVFIYKTDQNIPLASDALEKIERTVVSEESFDQLVVDQLTKAVENYPSTNSMLGNGLSSDISFEIKSNQSYSVSLSGNGTYLADASGKGMKFETDLTLEVASMNFDSSLEAITYNDNSKLEYFIKFNKIPEMLTLFAPELKELSGEWIHSDAVPVEEDQIDAKAREDITKLFQTQEFKSIVTRAPDRVINNTRNICISAKANEEQSESLFEKYEEITEQTIGVEGSGINFNFEICYTRGSEKLTYVNFTFESDTSEGRFTLDNIVYPASPLVIEKPTDYIDSSDLKLDNIGSEFQI